MAWPITPAVRLPLPSGKGGDGSVVVAEEGVAAEDAMLLAEVAVDAGSRPDPDCRARWRFGRNCSTLTCSAAGSAEEAGWRSDRSGRRNGVVRKLRAGRGGGIEDRLGEDALALRQRGGTTLKRVMPVRSRVPCQSTKKNVLLV